MKLYSVIRVKAKDFSKLLRIQPNSVQSETDMSTKHQKTSKLSERIMEGSYFSVRRSALFILETFYRVSDGLAICVSRLKVFGGI
jgi:hypothetical protein